jgi:F1F0 ATPase subunit 2
MSYAVVYECLWFIAEAVGWFFGGTLLGLLHFVSLRWNVRCLLSGQPLFSLGLQFFRFAVTAGALALLARLFGAIPLLVGTLGLMVARTWVLLREAQ